jgi:CheY-like chemotaxis protein
VKETVWGIIIAEGGRSRAKILIVDDEPDNVEATQLILQAKHHEVASRGIGSPA